jgi:hypothetical protein
VFSAYIPITRFTGNEVYLMVKINCHLVKVLGL